MNTAYRNSQSYKEKQARATHLNWEKGIYNFILKKEQRTCLNPLCDNSFIVPHSDKQKYCSHQCHYSVRRGNRRKNCPLCSACGKLITQKGASKFCSLRCQTKYNYNQYIFRWKEGKEDGNIGISTRLISHYIKRYLQEKYKDQCSLCGWNQKNPVTGRVPLEVDHIDGNADNNIEDNLRLICPNCHSLTPHFRNLNKGNGRSWRLKYIEDHNDKTTLSN